MQKKLKQIKVLLLMFATLTTLALGQSVAVAAIVDHPGSNSALSSDFINDSSTFGVNTYFIGTGSTSGEEITASADGSYHIIDPLASNLNLVRLKTNITGWTCWGDCSDTNSTLEGIQTSDTANITIGQMFVIVDGLIQQVGAGYAGETGADVAVATGTHVVTILYLGKDDAGNLQYASDTVVIRIATSADDLATPLETVVSPISFDFTDKATTTSTITADAAYFDPSWESWTREWQYDIETDLTVKLDGLAPIQNSAVEVAPTTEFTITGTVNSSGFDGFQEEGSWDATVGHMFLIDATGVTNLADNPTTVTMFNTAFDEDNPGAALDPVGTYVGIAIFAEYGRWNSGLDGNADHDGMSSTADGVQDFDASFDFLATTDGVRIFDKHIISNIVDTTTTTGDDTTVTSTNVVTNTGTTTKTETPGFGVIVSLLALGIIAFVAPRFRREN